MAIVKMNKFTLLTFESEKDSLLEKLQEFSNAEFINLQDEELLENNQVLEGLRKDAVDEDIAKYEEQLSKVKFALQFLDNYVPKQSSIKALRTGKTTLTMNELKEKVESSDWESIYAKVKEKEEGLTKLANEKTKLQNIVHSLEPYEALDVPLGTLGELKETSYFLGSIANQYENELANAVNDCYFEIISKSNQDTYFIAICNNAMKESVEEALRGLGFTPFKTEESETPLKAIHIYNDRIGHIDSEKFIIKEELAGYEASMKKLQLVHEYLQNVVSRKSISTNFLKTESVTLIRGWVPAKYNNRLESICKDILGENYYLKYEEVKEEEIEEVPIKLENNDLNSAFQSVTEMYALPRYDFIDPTPYVTPFYLIFFGMMVADAGYGIIMLIATLLALKYFEFDDGMKKMIKFFHYLSYPTIAFGVLYGGYFGDLIKAPHLIDTTTDVMTILAMSVVFGAIQIVFGLCIKAVVLIKAGKPLDAFMDVGSWLITLFSIGILAGGMFTGSAAMSSIGKYGAIIGAILIVATQGRSAASVGGKIGSGLYELYGITSYIGDLVSYTRLMAIGLSGGSIAGAVNMIMKMIPGPIGVFLLGPLIFIIFQTVNLGLSLLSGYVHTLRLTYVEYFGKFYDGGGKNFKPFETKSKYINLKRD